MKTVAILGGGMAGLSTAFHLTNDPGWRERYRIVVYQQGWRLGGKCASGRNGGRIEEHGLHVLFGWYENTFRLIRRCYSELGELEALPGAFLPCETLVAPEIVDGKVDPWVVKCPRNDDTPGEGPDVSASPAQVLKNVYAWVARQMMGWILPTPKGNQAPPPPPDDLDELMGVIRGWQADSRGQDDPQRWFAFPQYAERLVELTPAWTERETEAQNQLDFLNDGFRDALADDERWFQLEPEEAPRGISDLKTALRRLRIMVDFCYTVSKGLLLDLVLPGGNWFDLDDRDLRAWLSHHRARPQTVDSSLVRAIYSAVFSNPGQPVAAGTILHGAMRAAFFFKGSAIYRPNGSIADVAFAPLYRTLKQRGVEFQFFHCVEQLELSADKKKVARVRFARQARVKNGEYAPLVDGRWPAQPDWRQLEEGAEGHDLENWWDPVAVDHPTLEAPDLVVLATSVAVLPEIFKDAMFDPANHRFQWMVRSVATTQTQAMQLWFEDDGPGPLPESAPVAIPYEMPFDTVADMAHILSQESSEKPISKLFYLCAGLDDDELPPPRGHSEYPARQRSRVKANGVEWLKTQAPRLWERSIDLPDGWLDRQYFNAPVNPSDRYTLVLPGSSRNRLRADESGYENLFLAGDWTLTAVSAGCLEAPTMAGIQAARAIDPTVEKAFGDWLPEVRMMSAPPPGGLVFRDGELVAQPPIAVPKMDVLSFLLRADEAQLQRLCDAQLNFNLGGPRYRSLGPFVMFYCSSMTNQVDPYGSADELDFGFWVPLVSPHGGEHLVTFSPYVWVDNSWALVSGRTLFGFPKHQAELGFAPDQGRFTVETLVLPRMGSGAEKRKLVEVARRGGGPGSALEGWGSFIAECVKAAARLFEESPAAMLTLIEQMAARPGMTMVFLKQFPAAGESRTACYQALVESAIDVTGNFSGAPLGGPWEIVIHSYASHRIAETLGLVGGKERQGALVFRPLTQARSAFSAVVQAGQEVWRGI